MSSVRIRASSLPDLLDCPARWEARNLRGMRLPTSGAAYLGTSVHAGTAAYDESALAGNPISIDDAAGVAIDTLYHPEDDIDWGEDTPQGVEKIVRGLHGLYCTDIAPRMEYVAIEATCNDLEISDLSITLTGTTDRIYRDACGCLGIADIKTGKTAVAADGQVKTAGHGAQLAVYELLASQSLGVTIEAPALIFGLQVAKTASGRRAGIGSVDNAREMLVGDEDQPGLLQIVGRMLQSGDFYGNPRSALCSAKYCPAYSVCRWRR